MTYWSERQKQLYKAMEKDEKKLKKKLSSFYDKEYAKLDKTIAAFYEKFGTDNVIEYRNLMQSLPEADKMLLIEQSDEFAKKYPQYAHLLPVRNNIYKLNRLEGLQYSVRLNQLNIGAVNNEEITKYLKKQAERGVNAAAEAMGFGKNFNALNGNIASKFVGVNWSNGRNFSERIWENTDKLSQYLNNDIATGFARGVNYRKLTDIIQKRYSKVTRNDAYRLIYTEGTYVMAESSMAPFEDDFEQYRVSTVGDSRVCPICRDLSGQVFNIKDRQPGVNFPPLHPWCRCTFTIEVEDWDAWMDEYERKHGGKNTEPIKNIAGEGTANKLKPTGEAKMIEEAQENAMRFIGDGYSPTFKNQVNYKGISLESANKINQSLESLYGKYDMPKLNGIKVISPSSKLGKKVFTDADAVAAYNPTEKGIFLNKDMLKNAASLEKYNKTANEAWDIVMKNINSLSGAQKELAETYKTAGRSLVGNGSINDYIAHEMGHHVQWYVIDTKLNNAMGSNMSKYAPHISGYANATKGEYIAESFVALTKGETTILDPQFVEYMNKNVFKTINNGTINTTNDLVKRGTSNLKTIYLPKDEYAHVMSELNTHMSAEDRQKPVVVKSIGNYTYTIENHGFNNYRIIGKILIDDEYK